MFLDAYRGIRMAVLGERSFLVHVPVALLVVIAGFLLRISRGEWLALVLCISLVLSLEVMNSGLERLAKAVTQERNVHVGAALDMAAGAVLVASIAAAVCGALVFVPHLMALWQTSPPQ